MAQPARVKPALVPGSRRSGCKSDQKIACGPNLDRRKPRLAVIDEYVAPFQRLRVPAYRAGAVVAQPDRMKPALPAVAPVQNGLTVQYGSPFDAVLQRIRREIEHRVETLWHHLIHGRPPLLNDGHARASRQTKNPEATY
jgi:hypothetical protein